MVDDFQIHQTTKADITRVAEFLEKAANIHRHLDWHSILDWIDSEPFLLLTRDNNVTALLAMPPDPPQIVWVRCFAVDASMPVERAWEALYQAAKASLDKLHAYTFAVGLEEWFSRLLEQEGFRLKQRIIVLSWDHHLPSSIPLPQNILIRPMIMEDLPKVALVDQQSFEPVWVNTPDAIRLAFLQSEHTSVAEHEGQIIGYEMSTANQYTAHLARLAVLPEYRHQSIGRHLVREMLTYFSRHGTLQVTVNTQSDNQTSLNLYKNIGFSPTYEEYPIYTDE